MNADECRARAIRLLTTTSGMPHPSPEAIHEADVWARLADNAPRTATKPRQPEHPYGLIARYPTPGGSWVDLTGSGDGWSNNHWHCHGCKAGSNAISQDSVNDTREAAATHASTCTAINL